MADNTVKEHLIELVRARPVLYSKAHKDFKDSRTIKRNNWDDIAKELASEHPDLCGNWTGKTAYLSHRVKHRVLSCLCLYTVHTGTS